MDSDADNRSGKQLDDNDRASEIRRRWCDILLCTFVSGAAVELLSGIATSSAQKILNGLGFHSPLSLLLLLLLLTLGALLPSASGRWRAFLGWHHFWQYPPIALAGILGTILVVLASHFVHQIPSVFGESMDLPLSLGDKWKRTTLLLLALLIPYAMVPTIVSCFAHRKPCRGNSSDVGISEGDDICVSPTVVDFAELTTWLSSDDKVNDPTRALFDHPRTARRIASRILSDKRGESTTAIIGKFGSGKSTIVGLIEKYLEDYRDPARLTFTMAAPIGSQASSE